MLQFIYGLGEKTYLSLFINVNFRSRILFCVKDDGISGVGKIWVR